MRNGVLRRAVGLAAVLVLAATSIVSADGVTADGDRLTPEVEAELHLGTVTPGTVVTIEVPFALVCSGFWHVDAHQSVMLDPGPASVPEGGAVTATGAEIAPPGAGWPADGDDCATTPSAVVATTNSTVTLTAPPTDGDDLTYVVTWSRTLSPAGSFDSRAFQGMTAVTFLVDVVSNTAPVLTLPADLSVEADTIGGWTGTWTASATDAEDDPDPVVACSPASGALLPLGATTVECSVEDSGGLADSGSFNVTVVDTTPPALSGVPVAQSVTTTDPSGALVAWGEPTATDAVDGTVGVTCNPVSGTSFPVGETVVTCSASDASGNTATASFTVTVALVDVAWGAPVGRARVVAVSPGRMLPLKASIDVNGVALDGGRPAPRLLLDRLATCGGAVVERVHGPELQWDGGMWRHNLDTSALAAACWRVSVAVTGDEAGAFDLDLRPPDGAAAGKAAAPRARPMGADG